MSLPTDSGKSLCYRVLPRMFDKIRHVEAIFLVTCHQSSYYHDIHMDEAVIV